MKKILVSITSLFIASSLYSLPIGNPADPLMHTKGLFWDDFYMDCYNECYDPYYPCNVHWDYSVRIGYYGDFVFNRDLRFSAFEGGLIDNTEIWTNAGMLVLNIWDIVDLYGMAGGTTAQLETSAFNFGFLSLGRMNVEMGTDLSWGVGARSAIWLWDCAIIDLDARYFSAHPNVIRITFENILTINPDENLEFKYQEWQVALGFAFPIKSFVPYFGIKWSKFHAHFNGSGSLFAPGDIIEHGFKNRRDWGYAFGISIFDSVGMSLNIEARLRDETALSVIGQFRL